VQPFYLWSKRRRGSTRGPRDRGRCWRGVVTALRENAPHLPHLVDQRVLTTVWWPRLATREGVERAAASS
jgi:hypothetical protein